MNCSIKARQIMKTYYEREENDDEENISNRSRLR